MGASVGGGKRRFVSDINVTPLVDVMLVLLVIFIITAPMMTEGLEVNLPTTTYVDNLPTDAENMVLTINNEGNLFLDTYDVNLDELEDKLTLLVKNTNKQLFLQADTKVPYGLVVEVMGRIRGAGIANLGILAQYVEPEKTSEKN